MECAQLAAGQWHEASKLEAEMICWLGQRNGSGQVDHFAKVVLLVGTQGRGGRSAAEQESKAMAELKLTVHVQLETAHAMAVAVAAAECRDLLTVQGARVPELQVIAAGCSKQVLAEWRLLAAVEVLDTSVLVHQNSSQAAGCG